MGEFFNKHIRDMPNSVIRKLKRSTKVTINPVYGQTKGYLEEMRKDFNVPRDEVSEERQKVLDRMAKARAARGKKNG